MRMVRTATAEDLDAIVALAAAARHRLAGWSPRWWRAAGGADDAHRRWLAQLVEDDGPVVRVVTEDHHVIGCAVSTPQPRQWLVDDVALIDDERWADAGLDLLGAISELPAVTCAPTAHLARRATSLAMHLRHVSSYWIRPTTTGRAPALRPLDGDGPIPVAPPHTFGGPFDPASPGALAFADGAGGLVVGSPSFTAPPVYDPGGAVCVVDRVAGDPAPLLEQALRVSGNRGDVLLAVVAGVEDRRLLSGLHQLDFARTVDLFAWPAPGAGHTRRRRR
jgi:hypothetical protein